MRGNSHVRFGSGGGVGDCPADHNLGATSFASGYYIALFTQLTLYTLVTIPLTGRSNLLFQLVQNIFIYL